MNLKKYTHSYFEAFQNKRLDILEQMFADRITLNDWMVDLVGKEEVLEFNKNTFAKIQKINISPLNVYIDSNTTISELVIDINNGGETIFVLDIIKFNQQGKISSIVAYKK